MSTCRSRSYRGALNKFVPVFKSKFSHRVWLGRALVSGVKRWYNGVSPMSVVSLVMITRHPHTQEHSHMSDMTNISINIRYLLQDVDRVIYFKQRLFLHTGERTENENFIWASNNHFTYWCVDRYCDMIHSTLIWESESRGMISGCYQSSQWAIR